MRTDRPPTALTGFARGLMAMIGRTGDVTCAIVSVREDGGGYYGGGMAFTPDGKCEPFHYIEPKPQRGEHG